MELKSLVRPLTLFSLSFVLSLGFATPSIAARDYKGDPGVVHGLFEENRVARLAASLGRGSGVLTADEVKAVMKALKKNKEASILLSTKWQRLVRMAQSIVYLQNADHFFPVGYEWESVHKGKISWNEWSKGSKEYEKMIAGTFGMQKSAVFQPDADDKYPQTRIYDEEGRKWSLTTEHVDWDFQRSGYELGTPPITRPAELEQIATFRTILGQHHMGQSNMMTGAHQTYFPFPTDLEKVDTKLAGRVAANLQILQANYGVAIHDLMHIRRMGGAEENLFFRPMIFDHYDLLRDFANANPATFDLADAKNLLFDKYIEKEFDIQFRVAREEDALDPKKAKQMESWTKDQKKTFKNAWKYRDTQLKINLDQANGAPILLWESRIGDYIADEPEQALLKTLIDELLINQAYSLAKDGKIAELTVPPRMAGETQADYWRRLQLDPKMTPEYFMERVGLKDPEVKRMILGKSFVAKNPSMKIGETVAFAFEMEGWDENLVKVILPRDPDLRAEWRRMGKTERVRALKRAGFDFDGDFNPEQYRVLSTEFYGDHQKYGFMHPELHVEASGNWEVKSYGRNLRSQTDLEGAVKSLARNLDAFGLHLHAFMPDAFIRKITGQSAEAYGKFLELQSFAMSLQGYAEASATEAGPWLDSWSLDRYSPGEIDEVTKHLKGEKKLDAIAQKYHNIAFRPVPGGLDIEPRDLDDDVAYGMAQIKAQLEFIQDPKMSDEMKKSAPIFSEFREHANLHKDIKVYTLEEAVAAKHPLTTEQRSLLHKFQFEIYKPGMSNYMYFKDFSAIDETPDELLDAAYVRTNYENNIAIPLLNYHEQKFLSPADQKLLAAEKDAFVDRIYRRLLEVQKNPQYKFLSESSDFLDLCDFLERSKHPSRPKFKRLSESVKDARRELLDHLTYELRGEVVKYVKATNLNAKVRSAVQTLTCPASLRKPRRSATIERAFNPGANVRRPKLGL